MYFSLCMGGVCVYTYIHTHKHYTYTIYTIYTYIHMLMINILPKIYSNPTKLM